MSPQKIGIGIDELFVRIAEEALKRIKGEGSEVLAPAAPKVELKEGIEPRKKKKRDSADVKDEIAALYLFGLKY
jgi:hypothetical protein